MSAAPRLPAALVDAVAARYRPAGRFAFHFARGKLAGDPVFAGLLADGLLAADAARGRGLDIVDLGCGQALLAGLLSVEVDGAPPRPPLRRYFGVELMPRDVERARAGVAGWPGVDVVQGDLRTTVWPQADLVVILDVLHYVPPEAQREALERVHASLRDGGRLLLRVGDAAAGWPFRVSQWVDRTVTLVRGHRVPPTWCRPVAEWETLLRSLGFTVRARPMHAGTPFANVLLVADRRPPVEVPAPRSAGGPLLD